MPPGIGLGHRLTLHVRLLLGVALANLPGALGYQLSRWPPKPHCAGAIAMVIAAATLVPVLGSGVTQLLVSGASWVGISGWQSLFLVEAVPLLWLGLHVPTRLPPTPADVRWLSASERLWLRGQLGAALSSGTATQFADGLRCTPVWKLAALVAIVAVTGGNLGIFLPLATPPNAELTEMAISGIIAAAAAIGVAGAVMAGRLMHSRTHARWMLTACLALAAICLLALALLHHGTTAIPLLAIVAAILPVALTVTWVMLVHFLAGQAAAAGFAMLGVAGMLGYFAAAELAEAWTDAQGRCLVLAAACLVSAWLSRGLEPFQLKEMVAPAASPGA